LESSRRGRLRQITGLRKEVDVAEIKRIYACKSSAEAGMIISLLKSNGFKPLDLDTSSHIGFAGADLYYYVQLPGQEYEKAKKFLVRRNFKDII